MAPRTGCVSSRHARTNGATASTIASNTGRSATTRSYRPVQNSTASRRLASQLMKVIGKANQEKKERIDRRAFAKSGGNFRTRSRTTSSGVGSDDRRVSCTWYDKDLLFVALQSQRVGIVKINPHLRLRRRVPPPRLDTLSVTAALQFRAAQRNVSPLSRIQCPNRRASAGRGAGLLTGGRHDHTRQT
jgi:hypothetical protein